MPPTRLQGKKKSGKTELTHDDIWDDSLLIKAYEESIKLEKEQVAKRLAMATNKKKVSSEESEESEESDFVVGDHVRSTYEDGVDYEAEIISIDEDGMCFIRFIGYENEDTVKLEDLIASWGEEAREEQKILAEADQTPSSEQEDDHAAEFHKFVVNKSHRNFSSNSLPVPPMPPMPPAMFDNTGDSEYLSAMLMSWYMSGYYTGLYHGQKQQGPPAEQPTSSQEQHIQKKRKSNRR
ncbi:unnamed protein product [Diamesa tonsa]